MQIYRVHILWRVREQQEERLWGDEEGEWGDICGVLVEEPKEWVGEGVQ